MLISGYINRYQPGNTVSVDGLSIDTIPIDTNVVNMDAFIGAMKLITYRGIPGGTYKSVYIVNGNTNDKYVHLYTVLLGKRESVALVNTRGVSMITGKYAIPVTDCVFNQINLHAIDNHGDADFIQLVAISDNNQISDTENYLTTLDIKNYDRFLGYMCTYLDMTRDLEYMYNDYIQNVGFVSKGEFLNLPRSIYDVLNMLDIVEDDRDLTERLIHDTVNGIPCPNIYKKYDGQLRRLVDNGYMANQDKCIGRTIHGKHISKDEFTPVYKFNDDLLTYCCKLIEDKEVEFTRKYILSKCSNLLIRKICSYLLITFNVLDAIPLVMRIERTLMEEVFITIKTDKGTHKYFIDLTLIPLICHGLRYKINEELM